MYNKELGKLSLVFKQLAFELFYNVFNSGDFEFNYFTLLDITENTCENWNMNDMLYHS